MFWPNLASNSFEASFFFHNEPPQSKAKGQIPPTTRRKAEGSKTRQPWPSISFFVYCPFDFQSFPPIDSQEVFPMAPSSYYLPSHQATWNLTDLPFPHFRLKRSGSKKRQVPRENRGSQLVLRENSPRKTIPLVISFLGAFHSSFPYCTDRK